MCVLGFFLEQSLDEGGMPYVHSDMKDGLRLGLAEEAWTDFAFALLIANVCSH